MKEIKYFMAEDELMLYIFVVGGICWMAHHGKVGHPGFRHEMMMRHMRPGMHEGMVCPPGMCKGTCGKMDMKKDSLMK